MAKPSGPGSERLVAELLTRLREGGCALTPEQAADALWLAERMTPGEPDPRPSPSPAPPRGDEPPAVPPAPPERPGGRDSGGPSEAAERTAPVSLYAPGRHGGGPGLSFPVRAPAAGTLPGLLDLQRALRPLQRYRSRLPGTLDEAATADLSARSGAVRPVFRQERSSGAEIQLLMDASASASVWQLTFDSLRQTCEQLGAFRDVQALYLHRGSDGAPLVGTERERDAGRLRPADQYRDTTGRRLTLVVSDCVGPLWQDGAAQRLLHRWSGESPLAVVQPLPPRLWPRTALPAEPGTLIRDRGTGGRVSFEADGSPPPPEGALPVPVLLPTPAAMGSWARLLGGGPRSVRGAAAWVMPRHHAMPAPAAGRTGRGPRELLDAFRATASPGALSLAVHLTAVPLVLPVIQLVQEAMLPDTGPMELAEVLLGGLLERLPDGGGAGPGPRYVFVPGVQELLMQSLDRGTAALVLKYVSDYVEQQFGSGTRNFPALAVATLSGRRPEETAPTGGLPGQRASGVGTDELFAQVPARVVRWYAPETAAPGGRAEAERLLRAWWEQGDPGLLSQARAQAEAAVTAAGGAPGDTAEGEAAGSAETGGLAGARLVLGRVLHALTETSDVRRRPELAGDLLRAAERELVARDRQTRFELVAVRHALWRTGSGTEPLHAAARVLREMGEDPAESSGTPGGLAEAKRRLWLGRTLLALARAGEDGRRAAEAAVELEAASALLTAAGGEEGRLCAVLLDLSAALRYAGADGGRRMTVVEGAEEVAGDDSRLRMRCARARARVHRDTGEGDAADLAYTAAERFASRDSADRCELLTEWGTMLLDGAWHPDRAEGVLREALTCAPTDGAAAARLLMLLGHALVRRHRRERFLPDLYEGAHLLEQAAQKGRDPGLRAEAWLLLGTVEQEFPVRHVRPGRARYALDRALAEARRARGDEPASVPVARALHAAGLFRQRQGETEAALAAFRSAADEWRRLSGGLVEVPWPEVALTRDRITALESG